MVSFRLDEKQKILVILLKSSDSNSSFWMLSFSSDICRYVWMDVVEQFNSTVLCISHMPTWYAIWRICCELETEVVLVAEDNYLVVNLLWATSSDKHTIWFASATFLGPRSSWGVCVCVYICMIFEIIWQALFKYLFHYISRIRQTRNLALRMLQLFLYQE